MKKIQRLEDLTPDAANANEGTLRGSQVLDRSLERYGAGRSIVSDKNGVVLAGNKSLDAAVERGLGVRVVQSDGSKLIVVQRMDLDLETDPAARELAYADNRASELGLNWNPKQLEADLAAGLSLGSMWTPDECETLLASLETRERQTTIVFDAPEQRSLWLVVVEQITQQYADAPTFGGRLARWADAQLAALDAQG